MSANVSADDLRQLMKARYGDDGVRENPMTAVGVVLLAAGMHGITEPSELVQLTGCSRSFISAIIFNLQNNRLLKDGYYDTSSWLSHEDGINDREFADHISAACGELWFPGADTHLSVEACEIFWVDQQWGGTKHAPKLADWDDLQCFVCQGPATHAQVDVEDCESHDDAVILNALCDEDYACNVLCSRWLHKPRS